MSRLGLGLGLGATTVYPPTAPTASAGVTGFWRADVGASASAWTNRLASGDFAQATGGKQPSIVSGVFGSRPGVRFDGAAHGMDGPTTGAPWQAKLVDLIGYYRLSTTNVTGTGSRVLVNAQTFTASSSSGLGVQLMPTRLGLGVGDVVRVERYLGGADQRRVPKG